jgi:extracellular factor (EF) 3-hydroxypalmitic acid methyl ester biosynthesis protein
MVNMIARDPYEGSSLFAKVVNHWFLKQAPAEAHRNRVQYLKDRLVEEIRRANGRRQPARIINLGCGPAIEVQEFLKETDLCESAAFTLLDFNEETLMHTRSVLEDIKKGYRRNTSIQLAKKSVNQILKEAAKLIERSPDNQYDFVYCAGLFDYLSDLVCQRLMNALYGWVAPGGLLVATNVEPSNPHRNGMEYFLDWHLVYRNAQQMQPLIPDQARRENVFVRADVTGVNLFLEVRKPSDV